MTCQMSECTEYAEDYQASITSIENDTTYYIGRSLIYRWTWNRPIVGVVDGLEFLC